MEITALLIIALLLLSCSIHSISSRYDAVKDQEDKPTHHHICPFSLLYLKNQCHNSIELTVNITFIVYKPSRARFAIYSSNIMQCKISHSVREPKL